MVLRTFLSLVVLLMFLPVAPKGITSGGKAECQSLHQSGAVTAKLVLTRKVEHLDAPAREPMIVEHPSGAQFVTGYGARFVPADRAGRPRRHRGFQ